VAAERRFRVAMPPWIAACRDFGYLRFFMKKRQTRPRVVKGTPSVELSRKEFVLRFHRRHADPTFETVAEPLEAVADVAWKNYIEYHKSPRTRKAGKAFADPSYELSLDWLAARKRIGEAERAHRRRGARSRILV